MSDDRELNDDLDDVEDLLDEEEEEEEEEEDDGVATFFGKYRWEICWRCRGEGKHVNPAVDGHGISPEEFREDPDFMRDYFEGVYDVPCYECGGSGKVKVPDYDRMTEEEVRKVHKHLDDKAFDRSLQRHELMAEDGYYGDY